jgi:putative ABC transport system ATP-binding protein
MLSRLNAEGMTIIMVTHENDIAEWARRVIRMRDGMIASDELNPHPKGRTRLAVAPTAGLMAHRTGLTT